MAVTAADCAGEQMACAAGQIAGLEFQTRMNLLKVTASEHSSGLVNFEGVTLKSILERAGVTFGESMKGKRLANCLLVEAADGYRVVIALPELDPAFTEKQTLLAFLRDGKPLSDKEGPYRIVIPDEKRMARWVRPLGP